MKKGVFTITDDLVATQGQRFLNFCIDLIFIYIIILSIGTTLILFGDVFNMIGVSSWVETLNTAEKFFYGVIVAFLYYYVTEMYFSRTIAKLITHTVVVDIEGRKPSRSSFLKRSLCRFIPFEAFSFFGLTARGWHDAFSNTYVVNKSKLAKKRNSIIFQE